MKVGIIGFYGKLGRANMEAVNRDKNASIAFGVSCSASEEGDDHIGYKVYNHISSVKEECDGIIDFSNRNNISSVVEYSLDKKIPLVIGTTGLTEEDEALIEGASKEIPILLSHNTGFGVNVLLDIVREACKLLKGFDIEIIEKHHNRKEDAPSGTSKMIFDSMKSANENLFSNFGRTGPDSKRQVDEVGFHSVRGGTIISDHDVIFAGEDEVITISHHAESDRSFANGALKALYYLRTKKNGLYDMKDVLANK